ncbi:hypothetical protein MW887_008069 [Aspergillus wentii]|nr:hypothetical protein MW887_008069 [Aspergillus wentii]
MAEKVRKDARGWPMNILHDWAILNRIVERFEAALPKRWLKRTREWRKKVLLTVYMAAVHRPDIDAFSKNQPGNPYYRDGFMWLYINLEDLLNPKMLLIYLNSRGRHSPHTFISTDWASMRLGEVTGNLRPAFLNEHIMMFDGDMTPEKYAKLVHWDEDERAFDWMTTQRGILPGHALLALEIQQGIYRFLLECCYALLVDIPRERLIEGDMPIQPEPPALSTSETGMNLLTVVAGEAPYRIPGSLNLSRLQGIVAAKRSAAEDHIWSLREDPGYFAEVVLDRKEHRPEIVPDFEGSLHPSVRLAGGKGMWNKVLNTVVSDAYFALGLWDEVQLQLNSLESLYAKYAKDLRPEQDLPKDLEWTFCKFSWLLEHMVRGPLINLQVGVPASPMRRFFVRAPPQHGRNNIRTMSRESLVADKKRSHFSWMLNTIWGEQERFLFGLPNIMDEMERLIETEKSIKNLISPWVMSTISDLSVLSECQRQISYFQPWAATFETTINDKRDEIKEDYVKKYGRFFYPIDKRRTQETTVAMQRAEASLDAFWKKVDSSFINKNGISQHSAIRHLLLKDRIMHRTPDWVEPSKDKSATATTTMDDLCLPLSELYFDLEQRTQRTIRSDEKGGPSRVKVKTRGTAAPSREQPQPTSNHGPDVQPTMAVDRRAHKVFSALFYTPSRTSQPGEVSWTDLLHAMGSTGFLVEKLYGSVWQFSPQNLDVERSIQFHESHPSGKIPFRTARRHGRRLNRAYGWHSAMFKLDG